MESEQGELTERESLILSLKRDGKTSKEIAATLGCSPNVVRNALNRIYAKIGMKGGLNKAAHSKESTSNLTEVKKPEQAAAFIDAVTDPFTAIAQAIRDSGLPASTAEALLRRLRTRYRPVNAVLRDLKTGDLIRMLNERITLALEYMDEKVIAEASFRDLSLGTSAMIEKRNLLRGEPTQVVDFDTRKKLNILLPALIAEARRRGIAIEGEFAHVVANDPANGNPAKG